MKEKLSVCGYRCDLCLVYRDNLERIGKDEVRAGFLKHFKHELDDEILAGCVGCPAGGDESCLVKACAHDKKIANCGYCEEFPCAKVRKKLDVIEEYFDDISALTKWDRDHYVEPYRSEERLRKIQESNRKRDTL